MSRRLPLALVACLLLLTPFAAASADDGPRPAERATRSQATIALDNAREALAPKAPGATGRDATMALLELRRSYAGLTKAEKAQADRMLARPSGFLKNVCGARVCVHYTDVFLNPDATTPEWAAQTLDVMESVWTKQVNAMGYRAPKSDGSVGGVATNKFDVYVANLGDQGLYGYCTTDHNLVGYPFRDSGYCVLDNDYAEFPLPGLPSLQVTAAHEFFHAIQFNYDALEDPWLMEATATWMEERYADEVNDNRSYLKYGQLVRNKVPLDSFSNGSEQYGNWIFFERLSRTYGNTAIRSIWTRLDGTKPSTDQYSTQAIQNFLATRSTSLRAFYARFAAGNLIPGRVYEEGSTYPRAPIASRHYLGALTRNTGTRSLRMNHLTSRNFSILPRDTLKGTWRLKVTVDGPPLTSGTAAYVLIHRKDGTLGQKQMAINSAGKGTFYAAFSPATVTKVTLTLANASRRFKCWQGSVISCQGTSLDNNLLFTWSASAVR